jgi:galactokinase
VTATVSDEAARIAHLFEAAIGAAPQGVFVAPGRVNLIGEHTDYNDGFVLPLAIDREVLAAASLRSDGLARIWSTSYGSAELPLAELQPDAVTGWAAYPLGVLWALAQEDIRIPGIDLFLDSTVPSGAGLSSSHALECVVGTAVTGLLDIGVTRTQLALAAQRAENDFVGAPTGIMDSMASEHGRLDHVVFLDCRSLAVRHVPLRLEAAGLALLVLDTHVRHAHSTGEYGARRKSCERVAAALGVAALRDVDEQMLRSAEGKVDPVDLRRAHHVVAENQRVLDIVALLDAGRIGEIGPLLDASHESLRYEFEVSCAELDAVVEAARAAAALGARMTGGGFGGSALALVRSNDLDEVTTSVRRVETGPGVVPDVFQVRPSDGARRL